jgi:beta-glucanase (GH16 family)
VRFSSRLARGAVVLPLVGLGGLGVGFASVASAGSGNLVVNPGFEQGTVGWKSASPATLSLGTGRTGYAGKLTNGGSVAKTVALNDSLNTVKSTVRGQTYLAGAWIRTTVAKRSVGVRMMEYAGSSYKGQGVGTYSLSDTNWHYVSIAYKAATTASSLDLNVLAISLPAKNSILIDDVSLILQSAPTTTGTPAPPVTAPPAPPTTTSVAGWGTPVWSDEFNGTSVDRTKWNVRDGDYLSYDLACIYARNVTEGNGYLTIASKHEAGCNSRAYTTGYLDTIGLKSWTSGRFDMRAKLPQAKNVSKGLWPAFWLRPNDGGAGEIDAMEAYGTGADGSGGDGHEFGQTHATIWNTYSPGAKEANSYQTGTDISAGFHVWTFEWEAGVMRFYFDGVLNYTRSTATTSWFTSVYDKARPFNIRLNQQIGGSWTGAPDSATAFPAAFVVDYVRVYHR